MTGLEFEHYLIGLLRMHGYKHVRLTEKYDLGVDIIAERYGVVYGIQAKRYTGFVGADAVRQVVTALSHYRYTKAVVITNNIFSRPVRVLAQSNDCTLVDRIIMRSLINCSSIQKLSI
jgi:restriction system protein